MSYLRIADELAADIRAGRLRAGSRLPPQRTFAYRRGIAVSTASRVYEELARRGLAIGEVGRGTYVRGAPPPTAPALSEPAGAAVNLELNVPVLPGQEAMIAASLAPVLQPTAMAAALRPVGPSGSAAARQVAAAFLARPGFQPTPDSVRFAGSGKQAIAAAIAGLTRPGDRIGVEMLSYPLIRNIAAQLGVRLVPLPCDAQGLIPEALAAAHRSTPLAAVYLQPLLHNPLGLTMNAQRRQAVGQALRDAKLPAIEDAIYRFLAPEEAPLAASAPEHTIVIDSLSKQVAPGVSLGLLVLPDRLREPISRAFATGAWLATGLALAAGTQLMSDGTAASLGKAKREDARRRQRLARRMLQGLEVRSDPRAYHLLLELPESWRPQSFTAAAQQEGIAVTPADAFSMGAGGGPRAVRLALASPPIATLSPALACLRQLALRGG